MNLLKVTQRSKVLSTFLKYPKVIFTPHTMGLTCDVNHKSCRRLFIELLHENKIEKIQRGFYKLKVEEIIS